MSLQSAQAKLNRGLKDLRTHWSRAKQDWHDPMSARFERDTLVPLEKRIRAAIGAMNQMSDVLTRVQRDCE